MCPASVKVRCHGHESKAWGILLVMEGPRVPIESREVGGRRAAAGIGGGVGVGGSYRSGQVLLAQTQ